MIINNKSINIDDLMSEKYMHKKLDNGLYLSQYQIDILDKYSIDAYKCSSIDEIIYLAEEILEFDPDTDDLDAVIKEISEFNYYANTNK